MVNHFQRVVHNTYFPPKKTVDERQLEIIEELIRVQNLRPFSENDVASGSDDEKREVPDDTASVEWDELISQIGRNSDDISTVEFEEFDQIKNTNVYDAECRSNPDSCYCDCQYCSFDYVKVDKRPQEEQAWEELFEDFSTEQVSEHCGCYGGAIHLSEISSPIQQIYFCQFLPILARHNNAFLSFNGEDLDADESYGWLAFRHMAKLILAGRACDFHKGKTLRPRYCAEFVVVTCCEGNLTEVRVDMIDDLDEAAI
jgi:hypothetical protein